MPGILYSAAMGWNRQVPSEERLNADISVVEYGDRSGQLLSVLRTLSQQVVLSWGEVVEFSEILNGRLPHKTPEEFWERFRPRIQPNLHRIQEINETIDACQETICGLMPAMDRLGRKRMLPYLLMSDGQKLLNRLAAVWETRYLGHANPLQQVPQHWPLTWKPGMQITRSYGPAAVRRASSIALARPSSGWLIISGKPSHALGGFLETQTKYVLQISGDYGILAVPNT